jgi:F0F1-type ATP synthase assembly protein I
MPTPDEKRLDALERRMEKYDDIIDDLRTIVIALKAKDDANSRNNQRWINGILMVVMIGATVVGGLIGAVVTHLIR